MGQTVSSAACSMLGVGCTSTSTTASTKAASTSVAAVSTVRSSSVSVASGVSSTSSASGSSATGKSTLATANGNSTGTVLTSVTVNQTMLVFAMDSYSSYSGSSGFLAYGIPSQVVVVPQNGTTLPVLNSTATQGNYGGIVVMDELSYDYGGTIGWSSALTAAQWQQLYNYQVAFGVRMVRINVYPTSDFGVLTQIDGTGCCGSTTEQIMYFTNTTAFPTAGVLTGTSAGVSTLGLWHYPAQVTNASLATEIAQFGPSADGTFTNTSTAAVINTFPGRQQMIFFTGWATDWSETSNFLQHAYIHWLTRGMYAGYRRVLFNTQIDDMHLNTQLYQSNTNYRITTTDLQNVIAWQSNIRGRLPSGSNYTIEIGHNGNGDIDAATNLYEQGNCNPDTAIYYADQNTTALEFQKPLGSGTTIWPTTPKNYTWSLACAMDDPLAKWWNNATNRDQFMHITHTFSHMDLDNATYSDAYKEINFNVAWLKQVGISSGKWFSGNGLIPPAITGLHNGDVIRAWADQGIVNAVGDNTRPVLKSPLNEYWPLMSNVSTNGYAGLTIMPRWSTTIFYDCLNQTCTTAEWINTSAGAGNFTDLLNAARNEHLRHVFSLHQDPYMFHQANLMNVGAPSFTVGSQTGNMSLHSIWVETVLQEYYRLANWPILTVKHDDLAQLFRNRMARDQCGYSISWKGNGTQITGATLTSNSNTCAAPVPVTFPGTATTTVTSTTEKIGNDPLTLWVKLTGTPITFTLSTPIPY